MSFDETVPVPPATPPMQPHFGPQPTVPRGPQPQGRRPRWRGRLAVAALAALMLIAVGAGGVWAGWRLAVDRDEAAGSETADGGPATGEVIDRVPDVRGMDITDATQALADAGVDPAEITVRKVPAALAPDSVVRQDPVGGAAAGGPVTLDVAKPAVVPKTTGRPQRDVVDELAAFGARVRVTTRYRSGAEPGTVLSTSPAAGKPLGSEVTVVVAAAPASVYLSELSLLTGSCGSEKVQLDGTTHQHGLSCSADEDAPIAVLLDRGVDRVEGRVGIPDAADRSTAVSLVVKGDGRVLKRLSLHYGAAQSLKLDTAGVLRLTVEAKPADEDISASVAFGDMVLFGGQDTIGKLDR